MNALWDLVPFASELGSHIFNEVVMWFYFGRRHRAGHVRTRVQKRPKTIEDDSKEHQRGKRQISCNGGLQFSSRRCAWCCIRPLRRRGGFIFV